jgi:hypothetical protein
MHEERLLTSWYDARSPSTNLFMFGLATEDLLVLLALRRKFTRGETGERARCGLPSARGLKSCNWTVHDYVISCETVMERFVLVVWMGN